jgi:type II secretory pathway pseudopilin PulG
MSLIFATQLAAVATTVLAVFAIATAWYARRAFRAQSREVRDQSEMLRLQSSRLELQERQFKDQRAINQKRDALLNKQLSEAEQRSVIIERQQAEMIDLEPTSTSREVPGLAPDTDGMAWAAALANRSPRPIRNVASRIEAAPGAPAQEASLSGVYAEFEPSPITPAGAAITRALIDPSEKPSITLIRAGETGAFLFPVGRLNLDAQVTVRFTDDAGVHWQIDHDLHLEKLENRDDW